MGEKVIRPGLRIKAIDSGAEVKVVSIDAGRVEYEGSGISGSTHLKNFFDYFKLIAQPPNVVPLRRRAKRDPVEVHMVKYVGPEWEETVEVWFDRGAARRSCERYERDRVAGKDTRLYADKSSYLVERMKTRDGPKL